MVSHQHNEISGIHPYRCPAVVIRIFSAECLTSRTRAQSSFILATRRSAAVLELTGLWGKQPAANAPYHQGALLPGLVSNSGNADRRQEETMERDLEKIDEVLSLATDKFQEGNQADAMFSVQLAHVLATLALCDRIDKISSPYWGPGLDEPDPVRRVVYTANPYNEI